MDHEGKSRQRGKQSITVLGSVNMDLVARAERLPAPGETLLGHGFTQAHGGKGANQAVAAARWGVPVQMIGCVGDDAFGASLARALEAEGIDTRKLRRVESAASGVALIIVDDAGQNQIVIAPGANHMAGEAELAALESALPETAILLLQLELPLPVVRQAVELAWRAGVPVLLDPAPFQPLEKSLLKRVLAITPNEIEASQLTGQPVRSPGEAAEAARTLHQQGAGGVLVTLGALGCYCLGSGVQRFMPGHKVSAVDTVAAGDAFNGAFAVALTEEVPWEQAVKIAGAAGALSATKPGAQPSLPNRQAVQQFLSGYP